MSASNMEIMIPEGKILNSNIRPVTDITALIHIIDIFQHGESDRLLTWKQRYKVNTDKIKTGKMQEGAEVVRDLMRIQKEKALNASEKKMLDNAHEFLISELGLIEGITENQIKKLLLRFITNNILHPKKGFEFFGNIIIDNQSFQRHSTLSNHF